MVKEIFTISIICSFMILFGLFLGFLLIKVQGE
jgi:PetM family of cytochrome b6f complex subunit 7